MEKNHKKFEGYYRKFLIREGNKRNSLLLFLLGTPYWTLWLNRNEWIFRDTLISSPREIICRLIFFYAAVEDHQLRERMEGIGVAK
jgi:hypothetical protein